MGHTYADDYIDYAVTHLNRWGDILAEGGFDNYNNLLLRTGRREEPGTSTLRPGHPNRSIAS